MLFAYSAETHLYILEKNVYAWTHASYLKYEKPQDFNDPKVKDMLQEHVDWA